MNQKNRLGKIFKLMKYPVYSQEHLMFMKGVIQMNQTSKILFGKVIHNPTGKLHSRKKDY